MIVMGGQKSRTRIGYKKKDMQTDRQTDGWMDGWIDGSMDGWMDR